MEIVIAILVSVVISLGISLYFHKLSQNNNNMDIIRKFTAKRQKDLEDLYQTIQDRLNNIVTEFKAQQTQANAAIKLFKNQNEEFDEKVKSLGQNIAAIQQIEQQIAKYQSALTELNDMTDKVEENLIRIHKESGIIDKLDSKISEQQLQRLRSIKRHTK